MKWTRADRRLLAVVLLAWLVATVAVGVLLGLLEGWWAR